MLAKSFGRQYWIRSRPCCKPLFPNGKAALVVTVAAAAKMATAAAAVTMMIMMMMGAVVGTTVAHIA